MSHRYRWPGIHERRKNAKVSDHCDRNKFARRVRQLVRVRSCTISSAAAISRQVFLWFAVGSCAGERRAELEQSSLMVINAATRSILGNSRRRNKSCDQVDRFGLPRIQELTVGTWTDEWKASKGKKKKLTLGDTFAAGWNGRVCL